MLMRDSNATMAQQRKERPSAMGDTVEVAQLQVWRAEKQARLLTFVLLSLSPLLAR